MTDDDVRTEVKTPSGWLAFQEYFVRYGHQPDVLDVRFVGLPQARPSMGLRTAIDDASVIVLAPSNPIVSIGPILHLPGVLEMLESSKATTVGVSPIIAGKAVKGPAVGMLRAKGVSPTAVGVARLYERILDAFIIDTADADLASEIASLDVRPIVADTLMLTDSEKRHLAQRLLEEIDWRSHEK